MTRQRRDPSTEPESRRAHGDAGSAGALPAGVALVELAPHADGRGELAEVFRASWGLGVEPVQWNAVRSRAGVLRGVHCHRRHADYLVVVAGAMTVGLHDLRPASPTCGASATLTLPPFATGLVIPPGVAHGFAFTVDSVHVYAVSAEWDPADELACRWDDPGLGIAWPLAAPVVSERDRAAPPLSELGAALRDAAPR